MSSGQFDGFVGRTVGESEPSWPAAAQASHDAPNVVLIVLDDVGFAQLGCYGSDIATPNIDRLARAGIRYANFNTTALCTPTRASLLTGRNPHSVGLGHIVERAAGFPGYNALLPNSAGTLAEVLRACGYNTWAIGKWHLAPSYETGPAGPFDRWPLGKGFERYYGFLGGSTDQYAPELYRDNSPTIPPASAADGYHLTADLVDESCALIRTQAAVAPHKPFLLYLAFGACHAPHQAPARFIDKYSGVFDDGWEAARERIFARQRVLGILPEGARLAPGNPGIPEWERLSPDEQRAYARMMEVYAGFLDHTDHHIGWLVEALEDTGVSENTLLVLLSDNGASAEGGPEGSLDEALYFNDMPQRVADVIPHLTELGGPRFYNHYPWGWAQAGNTPYRWYKQFTHAGGVKDPCIFVWPRWITSRGGVRFQYHHVTDILPTILESAGVSPPEQLRGAAQQPVDGISMVYTFDDPAGATRKRKQYYEVWGNRALWQDGWVAVSRAHPDAPGAWPPGETPDTLEDVPWELYDLTADPTETIDLANSHPRKLRELIDLWWAEAGRNGALPLDIRQRGERWSAQPSPPGAETHWYVFRGRCGPLERGVAPQLANRSFTLTAEVDIEEAEAQGVLYAVGGVHGGYSWYLRDGRMAFEINLMGVHRQIIQAEQRLDTGAPSLAVTFDKTGDREGIVTLSAGGRILASETAPQVLKLFPIGSGRTCVGFDPAPAVSDHYESPFSFSGRLRCLEVVVKDDGGGDPTTEIRAHVHSE